MVNHVEMSVNLANLFGQVGVDKTIACLCTVLQVSSAREFGKAWEVVWFGQVHLSFRFLGRP